MNRYTVQKLKNIEAEVRPFFNDAEKTFLEAIVQSDINGFSDAMSARRIAVWLNRKVAAIDDHDVPLLPWQAVLCIKVKWRQLNDGCDQMQQFYQDWERAGRDAATLIARLAKR